jgi:phosphatidylserine decarboxylase
VGLLARGTSPWLLVTWVAAILLGALALLRSPWWWVPFAPVAALALAMLNFFRDPDRAIGAGIVAPADGVVQSIDEWEDGRTRVATFMSPLDVHVNRAPLDARVVSRTHVAGGFVPAFDKDADRNERVIWILDTAVGEVEVVQIAGTVARRIVPYVEAGARVRKGDRIGIIRLGSRVDVYLPAGVEPLVAAGDRTIAGVTTLARGGSGGEPRAGISPPAGVATEGGSPAGAK